MSALGIVPETFLLARMPEFGAPRVFAGSQHARSGQEGAHGLLASFAGAVLRTLLPRPARAALGGCADPVGCRRRAFAFGWVGGGVGNGDGRPAGWAFFENRY